MNEFQVWCFTDAELTRDAADFRNDDTFVGSVGSLDARGIFVTRSNQPTRFYETGEWGVTGSEQNYACGTCPTSRKSLAGEPAHWRWVMVDEDGIALRWPNKTELDALGPPTLDGVLAGDVSEF
jgi:hypothetical protein